jgi:hypothetical protein
MRGDASRLGRQAARPPVDSNIMRGRNVERRTRRIRRGNL